MFGLTAKKISSTFSADKINKQIDFGTAVGLTKTAKEGQTAVIGALKGSFTLRGTWFQPSSKVGIRIKPATKTNLKAEITTAADWILKQIKGGQYFPFKGNMLAIPTENVRRNKRMIIPRGQRPLRLQKAFVIKTAGGASILFQRKGRGKKKDLVAMYILVPKVLIHAVDTFYEPIQKVVDRRLLKNIGDGIEMAFKTAK
jgi:hypothetical protein